MQSRLKNKIKAFTLSEMLVVLLLTVIVVGLAFSILNLVQKQMHGIQEVYEDETIGNQLKQALWIDFGSYSQIQWVSKKNELTLRNELQQITYQFNERYVLKAKDTFDININVKELYFQGNMVNEGSIDAIELVSADKDNSFFIFKRNTASDSMN